MTGRTVPESLEFRAVDDTCPGSTLVEIFQEYWPAYERWMRNSMDTSDNEHQTQLKNLMPELFPVYESLLESFGGGVEKAQFLSLYNPPRVVRGCAQIVLDTADGPVLLRSYDHHPALLDSIILKSAWIDRSVLAMTDCIWGVLDGINDHGLAVSLSFGGKDKVGPGFAAPLIARYILETCETIDDAKSVLKRVPVYMPYTFLVTDTSGTFVTAYTGPEEPTRFVERRASTNHQSTTDWPEYCKFTQSIERLDILETMLDQSKEKPEALDQFLTPPLWRNDYAHASGTLYVAEYRTNARSLTLHWPTTQEHFSLDEFTDRNFKIQL